MRIRSRAWQRFGLRSQRATWWETISRAKQLDSQVSGNEKQAKAASGRRTPN